MGGAGIGLVGAATDRAGTGSAGGSPDPSEQPAVFSTAPVLVFDGGCPFCRHFAQLSELRSGIAGLEIRDGRADDLLRLDLARRGYHLRDGAMVLCGDQVLHGDAAIAWLCGRMTPSAPLLQVLAPLLAERRRASRLYPLLLLARRLLLALRRLPLDPDGSPGRWKGLASSHHPN